MNKEVENTKAASSRNKVISIAIKDKQALYMSYMPYVEGGGLFLPTNKEYEMGTEMFLLVKIMDEVEPVSISGNVIWVTPTGALVYCPAHQWA